MYLLPWEVSHEHVDQRSRKDRGQKSRTKRNSAMVDRATETDATSTFSRTDGRDVRCSALGFRASFDSMNGTGGSEPEV